HFGDVDGEEADRIGLELALGRSFALDLRQPRDSMTLEATMKGRARQMWNGRLQSVEAIVMRPQRMRSKGADHSLFLDGQGRCSGLPRPSRQIGDRRPRLPLGDGLR